MFSSTEIVLEVSLLISTEFRIEPELLM